MNAARQGYQFQIDRLELGSGPFLCLLTALIFATSSIAGKLATAELHAVAIVLDGCGLKVFGAGGWCVEKHGKSQRRWGKLSIGLDPESGEIVAHKLTDSDVGDPDLVAPLLEASGVRIRHFFADSAYDGDPVYETVRRYQADTESTIIIPPRRTATPSDNVDDPTERDRHIKMIYERGRMAWQKATDYGRRSLVETAFGRYKSIIGDSLSARDDDAQMTEAAIGIKVLNRMTRAAKPISVRA